MRDGTLPALFETALRALPSGPLALGYSGGLDSSVLLHLTAHSAPARERGLRALHVDHALQPQSGDWARHCRTVAAALGVELLLLDVTVDRDSGRGLEAAARAARHAAFAAALHPGEILTLAHHQDDQAETVLLRLLRASGSDGLGAMQTLRPFARGSLWRPLLAVPRATLLAYAQQHALAWIDDPSNRSAIHDRNFLRQETLPGLAARWPQARAALARSAELLAEDAALLRAEARRRLAAVQSVDPQVLAVDALLREPPPWRARMLRYWIDTLGLPPLPGAAIATIERELLHARADRNPQFAWADVVMWRWRNLLHVERRQPPLPPRFEARWDGVVPLRLPTGAMLRLLPSATMAPAAAAATPATPIQVVSTPMQRERTTIERDCAFDPPVTVRARHGGERIRLSGRAHAHALKHVLQELGVPPWQRARLPLLYAADGTLLAAGDLALSARFAGWLHERDCTITWTPATPSQPASDWPARGDD